MVEIDHAAPTPRRPALEGRPVTPRAPLALGLIASALVAGALALTFAVQHRRTASTVADADAWKGSLDKADASRAAGLFGALRALPGEDEPVSCAVCHGTDGAGNYGIDNPRHLAPRLAGLNALYVGEQLRLYAAGKRQFPLMNAMAAPLSDQDVADLASYVHALKGPRIAVPIAASYETLSRGRNIWISGLTARAAPCASCHGVDGGGKIRRSPEVAGEPIAYLERELKVMRDRGRTGTVAAETMTMEAHRLTDAEISDVATYIGSIEPSNIQKRP